MTGHLEIETRPSSEASHRTQKAAIKLPSRTCRDTFKSKYSSSEYRRTRKAAIKLPPGPWRDILKPKQIHPPKNIVETEKHELNYPQDLRDTSWNWNKFSIRKISPNTKSSNSITLKTLKRHLETEIFIHPPKNIVKREKQQENLPQDVIETSWNRCKPILQNKSSNPKSSNSITLKTCRRHL